MRLEFVGKAQALSAEGFASCVQSLSVKAPEIWAVLAVETSGCGFLPDRRPQILFERHVFHRLTGGRFDDGDISDPTPGGYNSSGKHQYDRLSRAIAKDRTAALQSASWGLGQILARRELRDCWLRRCGDYGRGDERFRRRATPGRLRFHQTLEA